MKKVIVISGKYIGYEGMADFNIPGNKFGNCMFYPNNKIPYRVCLNCLEVKILE